MRPLAIMACNDQRGQHVLTACHRAGFMVPDEVAVIGVDNDEILCELSTPPLSSVEPNAEQIGYKAAEMLDSLMSGRKVKQRHILIDPIRIAIRQSTDVLAIDDPTIATAVRFIREQAAHGCHVADILKQVLLSRSLLERRFRKHIKRSPQAEIRHVQVNRIRELLQTTDLKLAQIAELTGFEHPEYMSVVFKREIGQTPGQFRSRREF